MDLARMRADGWKYVVKAYYNSEVQPPKPKNGIAFITKHKTKFSKDVEVSAAQGRKDIGTIEVIDL